MEPTRKVMEEKWIGQLCQAIHPEGLGIKPEDEFWAAPVRKEEPDYQPDRSRNIIDEYKLKSSTAIWWTKGVTPLKLSLKDRLLVVDIVRDARGEGKPRWAGIVLFQEKLYALPIAALFLGD